MRDMPVRAARMKVLFGMRDLAVDGMDSWVSRVVAVSPDGGRLEVDRAMPTRIQDGTEWRQLRMDYDVDRNCWADLPAKGEAGR